MIRLLPIGFRQNFRIFKLTKPNRLFDNVQFGDLLNEFVGHREFAAKFGRRSRKILLRLGIKRGVLNRRLGEYPHIIANNTRLQLNLLLSSSLHVFRQFCANCGRQGFNMFPTFPGIYAIDKRDLLHFVVIAVANDYFPALAHFFMNPLRLRFCANV